jgi:hypothetical protein
VLLYVLRTDNARRGHETGTSACARARAGTPDTARRRDLQEKRCDRYQQTKARIGKQRGAKVAQIDLARRLAEAIWHMLSRAEPFAPKGATDPLAA